MPLVLCLMVPTIGLEPTTYALRVRCTTNCAKSACKELEIQFFIVVFELLMHQSVIEWN